MARTGPFVPMTVRAPGFGIGHVEAAARRLAGIARRTGVVTSASLDAAAGARVVAKPEIFQRTGSFKFRGAMNRLLQTTISERSAGVVAYSSGNHGAAVALAASIIGTRATIVVPADAPAIKLAAIGAYGAELRLYDPGHEQREEVAAAIARESGALVMPPFDDLEVMAGQGTLALELLEDVGALDMVLVPVGGGGLVAGVGTAVRARLGSTCRIVGVEPAGADDTRRSIAARERVALGTVSTIADGLQAAMPGELTFEVNRRLIDDVIVVRDDEIVEAMRFCFERMKLVVEPSGAVVVAALLAGAAGGAPGAPDARVGIVLSGGNVDAVRFAQLVEGKVATGEKSRAEEEER